MMERTKGRDIVVHVRTGASGKDIVLIITHNIVPGLTNNIHRTDQLKLDLLRV